MMNSNSFLKKFNSKDELVQSLADNICMILENCIKQKGKASLLLSGGNTPKALFEELSSRDILWKNVNIGLVDERWIDISSEDSNENLVKKYLLQNRAKEATFIGMYLEQMNTTYASKICSKIYLKELYPFDITLLGMGTDAHTASLFPNNEKLKEAYSFDNDKLCINIKPTTAPYERVSLTLKAILNSSYIFLHIEGEEKLKVYCEAIKSNDIYTFPISAILNNQSSKEIEVYAYE